MVRLDTNRLQTPVDSDGISGENENVLHPHISHLQQRASIATAATMSLFCYYTHFVITLFSLGSHHERYSEVAVH